ncbi:MAG: hypothetical protein Q8M68_00600 [Polaromonas sp.]|nr:hypothetical protein [Polaromonas sp.]
MPAHWLPRHTGTQDNPGPPAPAGPSFPVTPACERTTFSSDAFFIAGNVPAVDHSLNIFISTLISLSIFDIQMQKSTKSNGYAFAIFSFKASTLEI